MRARQTIGTRRRAESGPGWTSVGMGRRLLPLPLLLGVTASSLPSSDAVMHCGPAFPNGSSAACGPDNQLCPFNGTGNPGMRKDNAFSQLGPYGKAVGYHIRDLTCGLNECVHLLTATASSTQHC